MRTTLLAAALLLTGCNATAPPPGGTAAQGEPLPAKPGAASEMGASDFAAGTSPPTLPASIPLGITTTRFDANGRPSVAVSSSDGSPVEWTRSEVRIEPSQFDPEKVVALAESADLWDAQSDRPRTLRLCSYLQGLPSDTLFLELVSAESTVSWTDDSRGKVEEIWSQGGDKRWWGLDVVTTELPAVPSVESLRLALDLHRTTRAERFEARIGLGETAEFRYGTLLVRWILSADRSLSKYSAGAHQEPITPLLKRGLYPGQLERLVDAKGDAIVSRGGGGAGSQSWHWMGKDSPGDIELPVLVTVDIPRETSTTRVVVNIKGFRTVR